MHGGEGIEDVEARSGRLAETELAAGEIIRAVGRAVPSPTMLQALAAKGVEIGGKDPMATMSARLSRAPSLEFQRGLGWALKSAAAPRGEAADPAPEQDESAASVETTNDAERRGEVAYDNIAS